MLLCRSALDASWLLDPESSFDAAFRELAARLQLSPKPEGVVVPQGLHGTLLDPGASASSIASYECLCATGRLMPICSTAGVPVAALGPLGEALDAAGLEEQLLQHLGRAAGGAPAPRPDSAGSAGAGLKLLMLFAKLYRVRQATQQIVLLEGLLSSGHSVFNTWQPESEDYLRLLRQLWEEAMQVSACPSFLPTDKELCTKPTISSEVNPLLCCVLVQWNHEGQLTLLEAEGLAGVMSAFLQRALPILADHYTLLPGPAEKVRPASSRRGGTLWPRYSGAKRRGPCAGGSVPRGAADHDGLGIDVGPRARTATSCAGGVSASRRDCSCANGAAAALAGRCICICGGFGW
jgi:hypothetical protein